MSAGPGPGLGAGGGGAGAVGGKCGEAGGCGGREGGEWKRRVQRRRRGAAAWVQKGEGAAPGAAPGLLAARRRPPHSPAPAAWRRKVLGACELALKLEEDKALILRLVQQKMDRIAPNLSVAVRGGVRGRGARRTAGGCAGGQAGRGRSGGQQAGCPTAWSSCYVGCVACEERCRCYLWRWWMLERAGRALQGPAGDSGCHAQVLSNCQPAGANPCPPACARAAPCCAARRWVLRLRRNSWVWRAGWSTYPRCRPATCRWVGGRAGGWRGGTRLAERQGRGRELGRLGLDARPGGGLPCWRSSPGGPMRA